MIVRLSIKRLLKQKLKGETAEKITEHLVPAVYVP